MSRKRKKNLVGGALVPIQKALAAATTTTTKPDENVVPTECTCKLKPLHPGMLHTHPCAIAKYKPWQKQDCEWVPHLNKFVWYHGTGATRQLVDTDGDVIPRYDCYCTPPNKYTCTPCGVSRSKPEDEWKLKTAPTYAAKDRHYGAKLTFPDGTTIWASSAHKRKAGEPKPDFGLYLASSWDPECLAYRLPWKDYGLPEINHKVALWAIEQAFESAKSINVEVGCVGGHGRTGTVLACMATMAGVAADDAVKWVRDNYCTHAVESEEQGWFVKWFDCTRKGVEPPAKPAPKTYTSTTSSTSYPHYSSGSTGSKKCTKCANSVWGSFDLCWTCDKKEEKAKKEAKTAPSHPQMGDSWKPSTNAVAPTLDVPPIDCPACHKQMDTSKVKDSIQFCDNELCKVWSAHKSDAYGWVFYNSDDVEITTEKELPFTDLHDLVEDPPDEQAIVDDDEYAMYIPFEQAMSELRNTIAAAWDESEERKMAGDLAGVKSLVEHALVLEDELASIQHVRDNGHPDCQICERPQPVLWKNGYMGVVCINSDCPDSTDEVLTGYMVIYPGDYIEEDALV